LFSDGAITIDVRDGTNSRISLFDRDTNVTTKRHGMSSRLLAFV